MAVERGLPPCGAGAMAFYRDSQACRNRHQLQILWRRALASNAGNRYVGIMLNSLHPAIVISCDRAQ